MARNNKKLTKTQEYLRDILRKQPNYTALSRDTKIPASRLQELYGGRTPTASESGKIRGFVNRKLDISVAEVSEVGGFRESEIKDKMKYRFNKRYGASINVKKQRETINRLTREDFYIVGHRKNGNLAIYYVIIIEDIRTGVVTVGHGFSNYYDVIERVRKADGNLIITETAYDNEGNPYKFLTTYYGILNSYLTEMEDGQSLADYVREHR